MKVRKILCVLALAAGFAANAQDSQRTVVVVDPLFEYPIAPEEIDGIQEKATWVAEHFWDPMDFKKAPVDQSALNHAMSVYTTSFRWAPKDEAEKSLNALLDKVEKNPTLLLQFVKAAEENLYGPRAELWSDEAYLPFLKAIVKNKKVAELRRARYERQLKLIESSLVGGEAPSFEYKDVAGGSQMYRPDGRIAIIEFGDPSCSDCRMARLRMESNVALGQLVKGDKVAIYFINVDPVEGWGAEVASYPHNWNIGGAEDIDEIYDLRTTPSMYVIGSDRKIAAKNVGVDDAINVALALARGGQKP